MSDVTQSQEQWEQEWARMLEHAKTRVAMYVGSEEQGHLGFIRESLRLLWQAKVFRRPLSATVDIAPNQCIVRCQAGPLLHPIQQMFSWGGGRTLSEPWREESRVYFERVHQEDRARGRSFSKHGCRHGWPYCFSGPTGPRLNAVSNTEIFARRFLWGVRTDAGLWCEAYAQGWPTGAPFLVADKSKVAFLVVADLDPQWLIGLPYDADDVEKLSAMAHRKITMTPYERPLPDWTPGTIRVEWHAHDDLVTDASLTPASVKVWL